MRSLALLSILAVTLGAAAPALDLQQQPKDQLLFQQQPIAIDAEPNELPSLTPDDFASIQNSLKDAAVKASDAVHSLIAPLFDDGADLGDEDGHTASPPSTWRPPILDFSQYTILEILNASLSYKPESPTEHGEETDAWPWPKPPTEPKELPFRKLGWIVNYSVEAQKELSKDGITLLAVDDIGLTPKGHHGEHQLGESVVEHPFFSKELREDFVAHHGMNTFDAESRRAHISKMIGYLIQYTTLPAPLTGWQIANHSTLPTSFPTSPDNSEPLRVRIEPAWTPHPIPHPTLAFNFYAYKRGFSIKAKNGIIHTISAPLFPPLSPLNKLFLFPQIFSTLTSGVQKVGLDDILVPVPIEDEIPPLVGDASDVWDELMEGLEKKGGVNTVFAPTNWAFAKLGPKLLALLHTPLPLSKTILKYVLSYHIIPSVVFHTDYVLNTTSKEIVAPVTTAYDVDVHASWIVDDVPETMELNAHTSSFAADFPIRFSPRWDLPKLPPFPTHPSPPDEPSHPAPPPHKPHPHHKANITHYALATLLETTGVNPNATAHVLVVSYRRFGKGPIRRALVVLPADKHHHHHEKGLKKLLSKPMEGDELNAHHHEKHGGEAKPVKVWKADVVSRKGAIHVLGTLLRPPVYHHKPKDDALKSRQKSGCKKEMKRKYEGLFA